MCRMCVLSTCTRSAELQKCTRLRRSPPGQRSSFCLCVWAVPSPETAHARERRLMALRCSTQRKGRGALHANLKTDADFKVACKPTLFCTKRRMHPLDASWANAAQVCARGSAIVHCILFRNASIARDEKEVGLKLSELNHRCMCSMRPGVQPTVPSSFRDRS